MVEFFENGGDKKVYISYAELQMTPMPTKI